MMSTTPVSLDDTFAAFADATRRQILERLSKGEARVTELAAAFPISLNSVSKHIKLLERANLVERRVAGRDHFLRLREEALDAAHQWLEQKHSFWKAQLHALDQMLADEPRKKRRRTKRS